MDVKFLVIIVCACCTAIIYVIIRIETLQRVKLQSNYEKQLTQMRELLDAAQSDSVYKGLLVRRDTLHNDLHNAKMQIYSETSKWSEREWQLKDIYDKLIHYRSWNMFQTFVNQQFNGFLSNLNDHYPNLTEQQQLLCFLYLLNLENEDIALIMHFQASSLPNTKLRLAKKMRLSSGTLLTPTLENILCS
ncbi:MAG: hypothetical protein KBT27_09670 [Prevotellaceae bacterium]|nr:hypothetical protein [Candidatus Faecinaster equi]